MAPKSVTFRRHDHLVSVLFGDLLSHSYNITFSMFLYLVITDSHAVSCELAFIETAGNNENSGYKEIYEIGTIVILWNKICLPVEYVCRVANFRAIE